MVARRLMREGARQRNSPVTRAWVKGLESCEVGCAAIGRVSLPHLLG